MLDRSADSSEDGEGMNNFGRGTCGVSGSTLSSYSTSATTSNHKNRRVCDLGRVRVRVTFYIICQTVWHII